VIKLAHLLWIDEQYSSDLALINSLGDAYLCSMNILFRNIRNAFLRHGFRYACDASRLWRDYNIAPLFCLQRMIDEGLVPYNDTTATLREISSANPTIVVSPKLLFSLVKKNYVLHEAAHLVANQIVSHEDAFRSILCSTPAEQFVLKALTCESFANSVETIAAGLADSDTHYLFLLLNSYVEYSWSSQKTLRSVLPFFDIRSLFRLAFLTFLFENTHGTPPSDPVLESYIELGFGSGVLRARDKLLLKMIARRVFGLSEGFTQETSLIFFQLNRCEEEYRHFKGLRLSSEDIGLLGILPHVDELTELALQGRMSTTGPSEMQLSNEFRLFQ
jgi:hypothetical protein